MPESAAIVLARAHLESEFTDYLIIAADSKKTPVELIQINGCQTEANKQVLIKNFIQFHQS